MRDKDRDLRDEIQSHLDMATADRVERGATPSDAAASARRQLGNLSQIQEATRDVWGGRWIGQAAQDIRYALRIFRRSPGFALVAILSLTFGIGANTALFEVVNAVRLRTLPVTNPENLVEVRLTSMDSVRGNRNTWFNSVSYPIWREIQARQTALSGLFAWSPASFNLAQGGEARRADGLFVSGEFFPTLGLQPAAGRLLSSEDDRPGCAPRAVLSDGFWRRTYGADPSIVGRTIDLDSHAIEIVGVVAPGFHGLEVGRAFDVALPLCTDPIFDDDDGTGRLESGATWWLSVFGRLKPGWSAERAAAHFSAISPGLFKASLPSNYPPVSVQSYLDLKLTAEPGGSGLSQLRERYATPLWLLLGISGVVLIIACANLANLLLARASAREREIAIRLGLGASRGRVMRQLLTESLVLVVIGTACALVLAGTLGQWLISALETSDSRIILPLGIDWTVFGFACGLALTTCVLFGLAPAIRGTGVAAGTIMHGARGMTAGRESLAIRRTLVVVQIALSVALLFASFLFARTLRNVLSVDPGFHADGVLVAELNLTTLRLPADRLAVVRHDVMDRIRALPGVQSAATVSVVPLSGSSGSNEVWPEGDRSRNFESLINSAGSGYFSTLQVPLVAGRDFDERDIPQSMPVAIVNETFAAKLGGNAAAIGQRFTRERTPRNPEKTYEIVGVVKDSSYSSLTEDPHPVACYADNQGTIGSYARLLVRSTLPATAVTSAITAALANADRRIEVSYAVFPTMIRDTVVQQTLLAWLSGGFGALAAILTMVGLYGLVAYTVSRRTGEIGIRIALGATAADVVNLLLREMGVLLVIGAACGVVLALAGGPTAAALLYRVEPYDLPMLAAAVTLLGTIALAASFVPARRATRIEPVAALRTE